MATYTAIYHINLSIDIEADSPDEAFKKLDDLCYSVVDEDANIADYDLEFDFMLDEQGREYY